MSAPASFTAGTTPQEAIRRAWARDPGLANGYTMKLNRSDTLTLQNATRAVICTDGSYTHRGKWKVTLDLETFIQVIADLQTAEEGGSQAAGSLRRDLLSTIGIEEI